MVGRFQPTIYFLLIFQGFLGTSQEGFEPPTHSLEGCCSIRLSY